MSSLPPDAPHDDASGVDPSGALRRLDAGNRRFVAGEPEHPRRDAEHRASLVGGQRPHAAILGCSDSRVPHEILFDEGFGDIFSVRVAGNSAHDPLVIGTIEYAVVELGVPTVVVLGHEDCGAVKAAIEVVRWGSKLPGALPAVVEPLLPIVESTLRTLPHGTPEDEIVDACVRANVTHTVERLSHVEILANAVSTGRLAVAGRWYRLGTGEALAI